MTALAQKKCVPCEGGDPALSEDAARDLLKQVEGWKLVPGKEPHIEKTFKFEGFMPGVEFVNKIARVAEDEGHHPDLLVSWGKVTVNVSTHAVHGLSENDFILAAKIDQLTN